MAEQLAERARQIIDRHWPILTRNEAERAPALATQAAKRHNVYDEGTALAAEVAAAEAAWRTHTDGYGRLGKEKVDHPAVRQDARADTFKAAERTNGTILPKAKCIFLAIGLAGCLSCTAQAGGNLGHADIRL